VPERVEHEGAAALVGRVVDDDDAVVGRLGVTAAWCHRHREAAGDHPEEGAGGGSPSTESPGQEC
jgi:hypothetical protein